jgi:hypothetical protein
MERLTESGAGSENQRRSRSWALLHLRQIRSGNVLVHRKTRRDGMTAQLRDQGRAASAMHDRRLFAYRAVPNNFRAVLVFRVHIKEPWPRALRRRSRRGRNELPISQTPIDECRQKLVLRPFRFAVIGKEPRGTPVQKAPS